MATIDELRKKYTIPCLYHFTDVRNLDSISEHGGLYSMRELRRRRIAVPRPGGNWSSKHTDELRNHDDYVRLSWLPNHPMEYLAREEGRIGPTKFLEILTDVLDNPEIRYTLVVATTVGAELMTLDEFASEFDFEVAFTRMDWRDPVVNQRLKAAQKAEILVPKHVPIDLIRGL